MAIANTVFVDGQGGTSASQLNAMVQSCQTAANLRNFSGTTGQQVILQGIAAPSDGNGGIFLWVTGAGPYVDDNINTIVPNGVTGGAWIRLPISAVAGIAVVATRTAMAQLPTNRVSVAVLTEGNRGGLFQWDSTVPLSTYQIDTKQGIFVAPNSPANGAWVRIYNGSPINAAWFGALDDSDPTAALQASIDTTYYGLASCSVFWPARLYVTTDTIHLGYGVIWNGSVYSTINLTGDGGSEISNKPGTVIAPTNFDRPAIAVSAGRQATIRNIAFIDAGGAAYMEGQGLRFPTSNAASEDIATWIPPTWPSSASSQYAPFCAIAVDPYSGVAPSPAYPNVTFPSWLGVAAQYGKSASSDTVIERCFFNGFMCQIAFTPANYTEQDDFARVHHCWFDFSPYGISVGEVNSRVMDFSDNYFEAHHTCITGGTFGTQRGQLGSVISNTAFDQSIQWFFFAEVAQENTGPVTFVNCYSESSWKLGVFGGSSDGANFGVNRLIMENCRTTFRHNDILGSPPWILDIAPDGGLTIIGCNYANLDEHGGLVIRGTAGGMRFENPVFISNVAPTQPYQKFARTATPIIVTTNNLGMPYFQADWQRYGAVSGTVIAPPVGLVPFSGVNTPVPIYSSEFRPGNTPFLSFNSIRRAQNPCAGQNFIKTSLAGLSLTGSVLTMTFASRSEAIFMLVGPLPGDIIVDNTSGAVFWVYNRTALVVTAKLINNQQASGAYNATMNMTIAAAEFMTFFNTRVCGLGSYTTGTLTNGSSTITAVSNDLTPQLSAGYAIYTSPDQDNMFSTTGSDPIVSSVTSTTVVMTGNAIPSQTGKYLSTWVIPPPANI